MSFFLLIAVVALYGVVQQTIMVLETICLQSSGIYYIV